MVRMVRRISLIAVTCFLTASSLAQSKGTEQKPHDSMMYSCEVGPVLSVSVSTPKRDGIPGTEIKLTDPSSRQQGMNMTGSRIPESRYEVVAEVPEFPKMSMQHAVEVCGSEEGEYLLTLYEHGDERY